MASISGSSCLHWELSSQRCCENGLSRKTVSTFWVNLFWPVSSRRVIFLSYSTDILYVRPHRFLAFFEYRSQAMSIETIFLFVMIVMVNRVGFVLMASTNQWYCKWVTFKKGKTFLMKLSLVQKTLYKLICQVMEISSDESNTRTALPQQSTWLMFTLPQHDTTMETNLSKVIVQICWIYCSCTNTNSACSVLCGSTLFYTLQASRMYMMDYKTFLILSPINEFSGNSLNTTPSN